MPKIYTFGLRRSVSVLLSMMVFALGACASGEESVGLPVSSDSDPSPSPVLALGTVSPLADGWPFRWLKGIPCRAPCWEGITPGQTTAAEAVDLLRHTPIVSTVELTTVPLFPEAGLVQWKWTSTGEEGGGALFDADSLQSYIYLIEPELPASFSLRDIMQTYGEPSHVIARSYRGSEMGNEIYYDLTIVYLASGFLLDGGGGKIKPSLDVDAGVRKVVFFEPGQIGLQIAFDWASAHPEWMVPWQGMQSFDFYCRDESGSPCQ